jgi:hypothetical protein
MIQMRLQTNMVWYLKLLYFAVLYLPYKHTESSLLKKFQKYKYYLDKEKIQLERKKAIKKGEASLSIT